MKTLLITLLGIALISSIGYGIFLNNNDQNDDLQASSYNPYISYVDDSKLDSQLTSKLHGQSESFQFQSIKSFVFQQRKFFNAGQIMNILNQLESPYVVTYGGSPRKTAISILKPYIGPLSTDEAIQILKVIFDTYDGIMANILINQIYNLSGNDEGKNNLFNIMSGAPNNNGYQTILPQSTKRFKSNFLLTFEGKHVGFLIDQSESMNAIAYTTTEGTTVTRYAMLQSFLLNTQEDIFQNFLEFSYLGLGDRSYMQCEQCTISYMVNAKEFNDKVFGISYYRGQNPIYLSGKNDLYLKLSQLLNKPYSTISDLYICSDGMVPQGEQGVSDFIKLIDSINSQRRNKIRINTVSFLFGGNENVATRTAAITLLQTLADYTEGTFIQVKPSFD